MPLAKNQTLTGLRKLDRVAPDGCKISYADWYLSLTEQFKESKSILALELLAEYVLGGNPVARLKKERMQARESLRKEQRGGRKPNYVLSDDETV